MEEYEGTIYKAIGGSEIINKWVDDFYYLMRTDIRFVRCLATHQESEFKEAALKLKYFLTGWLGGPPLYMTTYGHPRLRMRHMPFSIGSVEAEEWLLCMDEALKLNRVNDDLRARLFIAFKNVTEVIKNRDEKD